MARPRVTGCATASSHGAFGESRAFSATMGAGDGRKDRGDDDARPAADAGRTRRSRDRDEGPRPGRRRRRRPPRAHRGAGPRGGPAPDGRGGLVLPRGAVGAGRRARGPRLVEPQRDLLRGGALVGGDRPAGSRARSGGVGASGRPRRAPRAPRGGAGVVRADARGEPRQRRGFRARRAARADGSHCALRGGSGDGQDARGARRPRGEPPRRRAVRRLRRRSGACGPGGAGALRPGSRRPGGGPLEPGSLRVRGGRDPPRRPRLRAVGGLASAPPRRPRDAGDFPRRGRATEAAAVARPRDVEARPARDGQRDDVPRRPLHPPRPSAHRAEPRSPSAPRTWRR